MQWREVLEELNNQLRALRDNLKKDSIARRQDPAITKRKSDEIEKYKQSFNIICNKINEQSERKELDVSNVVFINNYIDRIKDKIEEIDDIIKARLKSCQESVIVDSVRINTANMSEFDFKTAACLLPKLDGKNETVHQLIDGIELYELSLSTGGKNLLINYIIKTCIPYADKIRLKTTYADVQELVDDLKKHFLPKQSPTVLAARLQSTKQGHRDMNEYGRSIESLMAELTIAQAGNDSKSVEIFKRANEKIAIDVFTRGIQNREIRMILRARNYENLSEVINAAKEESIMEQQNSTILSMKGQHPKNSHTNNFRQNNSNQNFNHYNNRNNRKNDVNKQGYFRHSNNNGYVNNTNRFRGNYRWNNNARYNNRTFNNRNYNDKNNFNNNYKRKNVYFANQEEVKNDPSSSEQFVHTNKNDEQQFFRVSQK